MPNDVFTTPWNQAWAQELRQSEPYRQAAKTWEGSLVFEMAADPELGVAQDRYVYLDLHHGECRTIREAGREDLETADYRIRGRAKHWTRILEGRLEPMWALMSRKLRLERGQLIRLTPHAEASRELLKAAQRVTARRAEQTAVTNGETAAGNGKPATESGLGPSQETSSEPEERVFQTTSGRGLDRNLLPMRLWRKSKRHGIWDPDALDFTQDRRDWLAMTPLEREMLLHLTSLFQAGEESVALDLLPLIQTIASEGRLEEEMYLTAFLWEEAKHVDLFRRFLDEVAQESGALDRFHGPQYRKIFYQALPQALGRLRTAPSPANQAEASVTYNMIVEGVLAETGYHAYHKILVQHGLMPGMQQAVAYLKADESRHLAYGVYLLSRLLAEHGEPVWERIEQRMGELLPIALAIVEETFEPYEEPPFGLTPEMFSEFALGQFERRIERIRKARGQSLEEIFRAPAEAAAKDGPPLHP